VGFIIESLPFKWWALLLNDYSVVQKEAPQKNNFRGASF
jgi:hypothetical protein